MSLIEFTNNENPCVLDFTIWLISVLISVLQKINQGKRLIATSPSQIHDKGKLGKHHMG
jgi:hypothetical protein